MTPTQIYQTKNFNIENTVNLECLKQAEILLNQSVSAGKIFHLSLKTNWKNKEMVANLNDAIYLNNQTVEALKNEIKDRNNRITKK